MRSEKGVTNIIFAMTSAVIVGAAAFSIDVGDALWEHRQLQNVTDACALASVQRLYNGGTHTQIYNESAVLAAANYRAASITSVELGRWENSAFTPGKVNPNAVRVSASNQVATFFGRIWGQNILNPQARSVAAMTGSNEVDCLIPYGVDDDVLKTIKFGDTIDVSKDDPGNWGKIDIDGNMSSGQKFNDAMRSGLCGSIVRIGDKFDPAPGFAGVVTGFDDRMDINPIVVMPVVDNFDNGSSTQVTVVGFIVAQLVAQKGKGSKWSGELKFLKQTVGTGGGAPKGEPYALARDLVQ